MRTLNYLRGCLVSNVVQIIQFASALVQLLQEGLLRAEENWRWWILERLRHPFIHRVPHVTVNHLNQTVLIECVCTDLSFVLPLFVIFGIEEGAAEERMRELMEKLVIWTPVTSGRFLRFRSEWIAPDRVG